MKVLDKNVNAWQAGIIIFILLFANKLLVLPSLLYEGAKMEAIYIPIILFALELGILGLFFWLKKKFPTQSFAQILRENCGKVVQISIYVLFMVFFLAKSALLYNVAYIFFRNLIYKDHENILFLFCFIPIINHLAICGLRVIGRTAQLFFPVILVITLFCVIVGFFGIDSKQLFFTASFSDVALTSLKYISSFGDVIFVFLIMERVELKKGQWKVMFFLALTSAILVFLITLIFILSYTYTAFLHPYALFEIMSYVKEYGGLGRIDIISMVNIMLFTYFHLAIYLKAFMFAFHDVFQNTDQIFSVILFNFIFLIIVNFFILNLEQAVAYGRSAVPYLTILSFVILPIAIFFVLWRSRKKKEESS